MSPLVVLDFDHVCVGQPIAIPFFLLQVLPVAIAGFGPPRLTWSVLQKQRVEDAFRHRAGLAKSANREG
jgi:hypothetical protein